jgi:ribosomal protein S18 acetylase RimI-like enzyme
VEWDAAQKEAFVSFQFEAQHRHYTQHYPDASFEVILVDGQPAGRLYVARWPKEMRIVDVTLLPEYRNQGVGTCLLTDLQAEATQTGKTVSIHVERFNPALRLYARLGFYPVADRSVYLLMEWSPHPSSAAGSDGHAGSE